MDQRVPGGAPTDAVYVGKYRILGELGRGGMGVVYRALDEDLGREVALKSPLTDDASDSDRRRFLQEARAASRVSHPHVVPVYEVFEQDGRPWLAMEFINGPTLRETLARGRLPLEEVLLTGEQMADALGAAHARGVLHRDVKPGNIMIAARGDARLTDFGLARRLPGPASPTTQPSVSHLHQDIAGTLGYISPEQILGRTVEPSSDVFSLGAVLYEAATGRRAFSGETAGELFDATLHMMPPAMGELAREAPDELQRIVFKALAKRPDERYQSANELSADLRTLRRRLESQHLATSVSVPPVVRTQSWRLMAAVVVALAAVGVAWRWVDGRRTVPVLGPPQQLTAGSGWQAEPAIAPDGSLVAYTSNESGNADIWVLDIRGGTAARLTDDPRSDRSPGWFPDGSALAFVSDRSGKASIWKMSRLGGPASLVVEDAEDPAVSPDGRSVAFVRKDASGFYRINVAPLATPDRVDVLTTEHSGLWHHRKPAWSPDSRSIAYYAARDLWVVAVDGGAAHPLTTADAAEKDPVWSPDGKSVFFSSNRDGTRALWRVPASGGLSERLTGGQGPEGQPSLGRTGKSLVYSTYVDDWDVVIRNIDSGQEQRLGGERTDDSPVFSPDGRSMAFVSDRWIGRYDLWLQRLDAKGPAGEPRRLTDHEGSVAQPAFSPDGRWVAYYRVIRGQRDIWIVSTSGAPPVRFTTDAATNIEPDWSPDGRSIVYVSDRDGSTQVWTAPVQDGRPAGPPMRVTTGTTAPYSPTWSADGSAIAFIGGDKEVWIVAPNGRSPSRRLTTGAARIPDHRPPDRRSRPASASNRIVAAKRCVRSLVGRATNRVRATGASRPHMGPTSAVRILTVRILSQHAGF
jgi:Tol biopolymer transport system component/predicted Ser/Thr protein kinase